MAKEEVQSLNWQEKVTQCLSELEDIPLWNLLTHVEEYWVKRAMNKSKTTGQAAEILGMGRTTLKYKRDKLGIVSENISEPKQLKAKRTRDALRASEIASQKRKQEEKRRHFFYASLYSSDLPLQVESEEDL